MRYSKLYIPTVKDAGQDSEALNYKLLYRAGYIRKNQAGVYSFLSLGKRVMQNMKHAFMQELEQAAYAEVEIPLAVNNEDFYRCLAASRLSYKELPIGGWQIRERSSENIRPRLGLLQTRVWDSLEGYKLVDSEAALKREFESIVKAINGLMGTFHLNTVKVGEMSYDIPGEQDLVFFLSYPGGADNLLKCNGCSYTTTPDSLKCSETSSMGEPEEALNLQHTPHIKTIAAVAAFFDTQPSRIVKTLIYKADDSFYGVLLRGDRELSETKLKNVLNCSDLRAANEQEVRDVTGAEVGFAGPIGLKAKIICDYEAASMKNMIVGANQTDHHYVNAVIGRDFQIDAAADIRCGSAEDRCPECGGCMENVEGFVLGRVMLQGNSYTGRRMLNYINNQGNLDNLYILNFEVNLHRLLAMIAEKNNDEAGLIMPEVLAPFEITITAVHMDNEVQAAAAEKIYQTLQSMGYNVLFDDRQERVSVKFKDSELLGIPLRITVGRKVDEGIVELKYRTGEMCEVQMAHLIEAIMENKNHRL